MNRRLMTGPGGLVAASAVFMQVAAAQGQTQAIEGRRQQGGADEPELGELLVTARRRTESVLSVPFSINAQSADQLRAKNATTIEDVALNVGGFTVQNMSPGQSQVVMRGVSAGRISPDVPGIKELVGFYLDESVISLALYVPELDFFDLERMEVLRGPQGTLFGAGSEAGTVRYITRQPVLGVTEGALEAGARSVTSGSVGGDLKFSLNVPVSDTVAFRVVGYGSELPGFIDAVQPDFSVREDVNDGRRVGGRLSLLVQPNERLSITPRVVWQKTVINGNNRNDNFNILANPYTTTRPPLTMNDLEQFIQVEEDRDDRFALADLVVGYDFGPITATSVTTYSDRTLDVWVDFTSFTARLFNAQGPDVYTLDAPLLDITRLHTFTQELRVASNDDGGKLEWVGGAFYSKANRRYGQTLFVPGYTATSGTPSEGVIAPEDVLFISDIPYDLSQTAIFGEASYDLTDALQASVGVRWSKYEEERVLTFDGLFATPTFGQQDRVTDEDIAPRVMLSYEASPSLTFNAQASRGFRLGGVNDPLNEPLCSPADLATYQPLFSPGFASETVTNYEAGFKALLFEGRTMLNVAVFQAEIDDLQVNSDTGTCSSRIVINLPTARTRGVEVDFSSRLGSYFDFSLSGSYVDGETTSSFGDPAAGPSAYVAEDDRLPTAPRLQGGVSLGWSGDFTDALNGFANVTYQYVGDRYSLIQDQHADPFTARLSTLGAPSVATLSYPTKMESYDTMNLRFGLRTQGGLEAALFVSNLADERANSATINLGAYRSRVAYVRNQPRTYGVSLRYDF